MFVSPSLLSTSQILGYLMACTLYINTHACISMRMYGWYVGWLGGWVHPDMYFVCCLYCVFIPRVSQDVVVEQCHRWMDDDS